MRIRTLFVAAAFAAVPMAMAGGALADQVVVDITGVESRDELGNLVNVVLGVDLGLANAEVTGIAWDLLYTPNSPSWTSEPNIQFSDLGQSSIYNWDMGDWGGVNNSTPIVLAGSVATSFFVGGSGILRIEFWEDFVDFAGAADGVYGSALTITYVPAPASLALLGLGGLVGRRRRRGRS